MTTRRIVNHIGQHVLILWALLACVFGTWFNATSFGGSIPTLQVIPQPRQIAASDSPFNPARARFILICDNPSDRLAARLLQESARETRGVDCQIVTSLPPSASSHQMWFGERAELPETPATSATPSIAPTTAKQGYTLTVKSPGVIIGSPGDEGLFSGVQTLIQLLEQSQRDHAALPAIAITDWPTFEWRGEYFDASQYAGTIVSTRANIEREIKLMARFKLNCLCIEVYNLVPFKSFPYCADANTLSAGDWAYLVELAHQYHVMLIPSLQSFGQMYPVIWTCDEGKPYREATCGGLICPSRPENVKFLQGLYGDLISTFKYSPILGIGCSEVGMQWDKHYCPLCQARLDHGETYYDIFSKHARDCAQAVDAAAKEVGRPVRPMMWADEFYLGYNNVRWPGIELIPRDVIMGHWQYWSRYQGLAVQDNKTYDGISGLLDRGFDVFNVSASFEFNTYLHDLSPDQPTDGTPDFLLDAGIINVADQARWADVHNRESKQAKVWGGVCATFSQHDIRCWDTMWFAYALQAEYTWGDPARPLKDELNLFTDNFAATFYGAEDQNSAKVIASAYRDLDSVKNDIQRNNHLIRDIIGEYDIHNNDYIGNDLEASLKLIGGLTDAARAEIRSRAASGEKIAASYRQQLAQIASHVRNTTSLNYLITAAHKIENHCRRTIFLLDLAADLHDPNGNVTVLKTSLTDLQRDTQIIADETDELTHGADGAGYHKVLASLDAFQKRLDEATAK